MKMSELFEKTLKNLNEAQRLSSKLAYSRAEAANMLSISVCKLDELRSQGMISAVEIGPRIVYRKQELERFLEEHQENNLRPMDAAANVTAREADRFFAGAGV